MRLTRTRTLAICGALVAFGLLALSACSSSSSGRSDTLATLDAQGSDASPDLATSDDTSLDVGDLFEPHDSADGTELQDAADATLASDLADAAVLPETADVQVAPDTTDTTAPPDTTDTTAPPDTTDTTAVPDTADTTAPPDTADTTAPPDTADTTAPPDTADTTAPPDTADTTAPPDTADTTAPPDTADTTAPPDTADTTAPPDTADTTAPPDTADTAVVPDSADTAVVPDSADTAEPLDLADTAEPLDSADTAEPADLADTAEPADLADTAEPADLADTAEPADLADTAEPPDLADTADGEPADAGDARADVPDVHVPSWLDNTLDDYPALFSQVGLFPNTADRETVDSRLIFYEPAYPLWTDGAGKGRWLFLPVGAKIDNTTRAWVYPDGTVFFKHFEFPGQPIETRVLRKRNGAWDFGIYQWNAGGNEAFLLSGAQPVSVVIQGHPELNYFIPATSQCNDCHGANVQRVGTADVRVMVIGFDELRLNATLPGESLTQLQQLEQDQRFTAPIPATPDQINGTADAIAAKGWLHGNCAHCHNGFKFDARHFLLEQTAINLPKNFPFIKPQDPVGSRIYQAASQWDNQLGVSQMPRIGVSTPDPAVEQLLWKYISALPLQ